ncbi:homoaconitate hydratase [Thermanaerothrix daxensis]|uniref:3-isopropylmalate dehydratase small subunit n=1 Tax=Thermanaerothrix daxensis TaxID=869279 RepID=A0A0P6XPZ4_9CHLR|nr:homoaconitate hydratase [Thermanaerothrix daxensis]KPL82549.1 homoaconitate hydratase [Thermanaerothrix daxensis]
MARIWKFGDNVDTDQIVPGRYAPYMRPNADLASAAFIEARPDFAEQAQAGDIIVAGRNFGCGSSREYAAEALKKRGIAAIIAVSFARIFFRNAINLGLPLFEAAEVVAAVHDGDLAVLDPHTWQFQVGETHWQLPPPPPFFRQILEAGGIVAYVQRHQHFPQG